MRLLALVESLPFWCTQRPRASQPNTQDLQNSDMSIVTGMRLPDIQTAIREAMIVARKNLEEKGLSSIPVILMILQDTHNFFFFHRVNLTCTNAGKYPSGLPQKFGPGNK
jgi:hypothetical protein